MDHGQNTFEHVQVFENVGSTKFLKWLKFYSRLFKKCFILFEIFTLRLKKCESSQYKILTSMTRNSLKNLKNFESNQQNFAINRKKSDIIKVCRRKDVFKKCQVIDHQNTNDHFIGQNIWDQNHALFSPLFYSVE